MAEFLLVTSATPDRESALALARSAVRARLASGAQVSGPVGSVFWHQDELGEGQEWAVSFKTTSDRYEALEAHLIAAHPWDKPEVVAVRVDRGSASYLDWVEREARGPC